MKKIFAGLLLAAMLLSLGGCGSAGAAPAETAAAPAAAETGIPTEAPAQETPEPEPTPAPLIARLCGEWRYESPRRRSDAKRFTLREDMTYEYGDQTGTWYFFEGEEIIGFRNDADGITYYLFNVIEEDGFLKLLLEGETCFVRSDDYKAIVDMKYVAARGSQLGQYLGQLQYVGTVPSGAWDGPTGDCYVFDSLAYDSGLIYLGCTYPYESELTMDYGDGQPHTGRMYSPFDLQFLDRPYTDYEIYITMGAVYFIRAEYVEEVVLFDNYREVHQKNGEICGDGNFLGWEYLPEGTYSNFEY